MAQHSSDVHGVQPDTRGNGPSLRIAQFLSALSHRHDPEVDIRLRNAVQNDEQWRLLMRLAPFDRAHHLSVRDALIAAGYDDPDLLLAAALHDVGKADQYGQVRLLHRVCYVLAARIAPGVLDRVARKDGHWLAHGLYLAANHARLGAELAARTGASERCCALIAGHERLSPLEDPHLRALVAADSGSTI